MRFETETANDFFNVILCALLVSPPEQTVWTLRPQHLAKRNFHAESVDSLFCIFDVTIFVGSKLRRTCLCLGCHGDRMTLPFIGSRSDSRFR